MSPAPRQGRRRCRGHQTRDHKSRQRFSAGTKPDRPMREFVHQPATPAIISKLALIGLRAHPLAHVCPSNITASIHQRQDRGDNLAGRYGQPRLWRELVDDGGVADLAFSGGFKSSDLHRQRPVEALWRAGSSYNWAPLYNHDLVSLHGACGNVASCYRRGKIVLAEG